MAEVRFPLYKAYTATRRDADNAMMALLAGSRLAEHTLQLTVGSQRLLPEMFPAVPHIKRFNLETEMARKLLLDADSHLGAVAVPYALAVHEDFVLSVIAMIKGAGVRVITGRKAIKAYNMHEIFFTAAGVAPPTMQLNQFHLLRHMRNCQIHTGGAASSTLSSVIRNMQPAEVGRWESLTGRPPNDIVQQGRLTFVSGDIFASFAVTKRIGREINIALQGALPKDVWSRIAVEDYASQSSQFRNSDQWMRSLWGHVRFNYSPLNLTHDDLEAAAIATGRWTRQPGSVPPPRSRKMKKGGSSS
jgi:hypothetical protein